MSLELFHPVVQDWFRSRFQGPTEPQRRGWPAIASGRHTLIAAPTGSGKTLTAFLAIIDRLFREGLEGRLENELRAVYVSPLRALSNDMHRNLATPLAEIIALAEQQGLEPPPLRVGLRTGDTPSSQRAALVRRPPHILVTTPESLYLMLTAARSRDVLRSVDTIIVDEIHALVRDKRGSHLALSVERLQALTRQPLQRIGLSATQKPIERMAEFLVGAEPAESEIEPASANGAALRLRSAESHVHRAPLSPPCTIVDVGHQRDLDLGIEVPPSDLQAVCSHEQWAEVNARLVELIQQHRSTLIFVNTRRLAERLTFQLSELLGEGAVDAHHGSLAAEKRLDAERRLKCGELKAVVATASLELGIDVGYIDLVVQIGSPRSIATFLQRIGRSGHALGLVPKGRLFALTRDELLECMALVRAIKAGRLDAIPIPEAPLDVLAQQIVAEVAAEEWDADDLYRTLTRAAPYRNLARAEYEETLRYLSEGLTPTAGRTRALLHYDRIHRKLRARPAARLTAISNGGAIGEVDTIRVVVEPEMTVVGSVDEEFGVESNAGDIFLLGNTSWRIRALRGNDLIVSDAQGAPPTIPFWRGEAPGRTVELSEEVSRLRAELTERISAAPPRVDLPWEDETAAASPAEDRTVSDWLVSETDCSHEAACQAVRYVAAQQAAIGVVPTQSTVVFERFFDDTGGMQLVVHAPFGGRINRAWGLAMRKRFCRSFDFELQATADDDGFILSLGPQHSFPIESLFPMLRPDNARNLLEQALLVNPMFHLRWRWNASRALQLERIRNGRKVPPALQRFRSQDLLTAVFPKLTGCQEEHTGDHIIPDHPLVRQTVHDCLHEALDIQTLEAVLGRIERGEITLVPRDTREPSPFAYELLNANPYAFLDGGEVQERRTRMAETGRTLTIESIRDLGRLDPLAISAVIDEAQPLVRNADELHDVLLTRYLLPYPSPATPETWLAFFSELRDTGRATEVNFGEGRTGWTATERWDAVQRLFPNAICRPPVNLPPELTNWDESADIGVALIRGYMETAGPQTVSDIAALTGLEQSRIAAALEALEGEGCVLRGTFRPPAAQESSAPGADSPAAIEWCHRRLLQRIHRLTVAGLRKEIQPVDVATYLRFLLQHHGIGTAQRTGTDGLFEAISQLQGLDIPAVAWEEVILPQRVAGYRREWLDELCLTGEVGWGRLFPPPRDPDRSRPMASLTRVAPVSLFLREDLPWLSLASQPTAIETLSSVGRQVLEQLRDRGAMFATDILAAATLLPTQLDDVLGELVARGVVTSDGFAGLRGLIRESEETESDRSRRRGPKLVRRRRSVVKTGRWSVWRDVVSTESESTASVKQTDAGVIEQWAWQLLRRWGVVFRDLIERETGAPAWWALVPVLRRLEMRGEIRGGRFIAGVGGEQYATGEAVQQLRQLRRLDDESVSTQTAAKAPSELVVLTAADPLNLVGIITPHARVPSLASNRIYLYRGVPVGDLQAGRLTIYPECPDPQRAAVTELAGVAPTPSALSEPGGEEDRHARRFANRKVRAPLLPKRPRPLIS